MCKLLLVLFASTYAFRYVSVEENTVTLPLGRYFLLV